ncbi:MAG: AAA family ATPase [Gammaproteobacteria bacterium]
MYLQHFGLKEMPFTITPDTDFFMNRAGYQDALNVMLVALRSGEGFIKVVGEVGVGKTILCRKLINSMGDGFVTAYIYNPYLQPDTLLFSIADELGLEYEKNIGQHHLLKLVTDKLFQLHREGKQVVLCMDEVQAMPLKTLETVRLLTNLETEKRKLLQVVLFGQPELDDLLEQPSIRQLKQRITFSYRLQPLNRPATLAYIRHRLSIAGYHGKDLFNAQAVDFLHHITGGIPRLINIVAHKALIAAYGEGDTTIRHRHLRQASRDTIRTQNMKSSIFDIWLPTYTRWAFGVFGIIALAIAFLTPQITGLFP